jgi:hypothetical protein
MHINVTSYFGSLRRDEQNAVLAEIARALLAGHVPLTITTPIPTTAVLKTNLAASPEQIDACPICGQQHGLGSASIARAYPGRDDYQVDVW